MTFVLDDGLVILLIVVNFILGVGLIWINWRILIVTEYIARSTNMLYKVIGEFIATQKEE